MSETRPLTLAQLRRLARPVARSFVLSLSLLPAALAQPLTLAYLLARLSDTVADAPPPYTTARRDLLQKWLEAPLQVKPTTPGFPRTASPAEFSLWQAWPSLRHTLAQSPHQVEISRLWQCILQGQLFDLERTLTGTQGQPLPWTVLEHYTDQVAGCVGIFWNRLGGAVLPPWSVAPPDFWERAGAAYGRALQWVNICRDHSQDRALGRVYLGDADRERAVAAIEEGLALGRRLADSLVDFRTRWATGLPGRLATAMLPGLRQGRAVRLRRPQVYRLLLAEAWHLARHRPQF